MTNRLSDAVSPYLRGHADNPVDWWPWSEDAFAEAARRDVPVFISIGYATCHWCHVMARESFSDPELAEHLNARFVAIKVDREEHPDVDASYMAAASAFTGQLGWPLSAFATPGGRVFYAGTYFPPRPVGQTPSFRTVLDAIEEAWRDRRAEVEATGAAVAEAISAAAVEASGGSAATVAQPDPAALGAAVQKLLSFEDPDFGGLGRAPKFPNAPVLSFTAARGAAGDADAAAFTRRSLRAMAGSPLRDAVEGGFFRYAVQRDWSEPHYERMLYDNAQLLRSYAELGAAEDDEIASDVAAGIATFLLDVLRVPSGALASAQDSESPVDGVRSEGGYYALDADGRTGQPAPALDAKVLTGLNGMAIGALADAGVRLGRSDWVDAARAAADAVLTLHGADAGVARASLDGRLSTAHATLEDLGGLSGGLLRLALATGEVRYASIARTIIEACRAGDGRIAAPAGADPVLAARGLGTEADPSDGATPSGRALIADAALLLAALTGDDAHRRVAEDAIVPVLERAVSEPSAFGAALAIASQLLEPLRQLVVVGPDAGAGSAGSVFGEVLSGWRGGVAAAVTDAQAAAFASAGFELFESRTSRDGRAAAYYCEHFVCALPVTTAPELQALLTLS